MVNTTYKSTEDMIFILQEVKVKRKQHFYKNISNYYDERNIKRQNGKFQFEEDPSSEGAQGISKLYHEVLLLMEFLQTTPQVENMNIEYYDLYYTVIKNRKKVT